jgi:2-polyprenyl-6-methoxyphenol hydroxylase-like FAD-dependent oxidoreductase
MVAALELSRLGVDVRIVDKAVEPSTTSRALALQARTLELLQLRAVGERIMRQGQLANSTAIYGRGRKLATIELRRMPSRFNHIVTLAQSETERLLREQLELRGIKIERGLELISFTQNSSGAADGVSALVESADGRREVLEASYLIGADGAHSEVRHTLGLPFAGKSLPQQYVLGDLRIAGDIPDDQLSIFVARRGFVAVFPMVGGRFRLMATDLEAPAENSAAPALATLQEICDLVLPFGVRLHDTLWTSRFRINSRHLSILRAGNVFLGGDAAHVHSPAGGQGMNTGIQDMINLSWKLAMVLKGQAKPELLDTYQTERLPVIRKLVRATEAATKAFNSTNPFVYQAFTRLAPIALRLSAVQNKGVRVVGEVSANYRRTPIVAGAGRAGRLRAGDRVPDVDLTSAGRTEVKRLYELLDLTKLTLFVDASRVDVPALTERLRPWLRVLTVRQVSFAADQPALRGSDAVLAKDMAGQRNLLLVRPDSYLAAAAPPADPAVLLSWLGKWFVSAGDTSAQEGRVA